VVGAVSQLKIKYHAVQTEEKLLLSGSKQKELHGTDSIEGRPRRNLFKGLVILKWVRKQYDQRHREKKTRQGNRPP